jgi:hypothetical protein
MVSGSRLVPGRKAIAYIRTLGGVKEACVIGSSIITTRRAGPSSAGSRSSAQTGDHEHVANFFSYFIHNS